MSRNDGINCQSEEFLIAPFEGDLEFNNLSCPLHPVDPL